MLTEESNIECREQCIDTYSHYCYHAYLWIQHRNHRTEESQIALGGCGIIYQQNNLRGFEEEKKWKGYVCIL